MSVDPRVGAVIQRLEAFEVAEYQPHNIVRLNEIFRGFGELPDRAEAMPAIYALLERAPDGELGSPGPLVHELEGIPGFERLLAASLERQPAMRTVWMVNRLLNSELSERDRTKWLAELKRVLSHPKADADLREMAQEFLEDQEANDP